MFNKYCWAETQAQSYIHYTTTTIATTTQHQITTTTPLTNVIKPTCPNIYWS